MSGQPINTSENKGLYVMAGISALFAMSVNLLDVVLGFGETDVTAYGARSAVDWFSVFQAGAFKGLYVLGILNIVYMLCMFPVYFGLFALHRRRYFNASAMAMALFLLAMAIYVSTNAAIPMLVLSGKYAAATTDAQRAVFVAAGETALARGEDFTPGAFPGLFISAVGSIIIAVTMLRGGIFGRVNAWIGIVGFTLLTLFTISATFIPALYQFAYYAFGMIGGLLALAWFVLTALRFFRLSRASQ